jgi:hypothetical protein
MGGKTGTTTQQSSVSIPPEVLARYNSVNARAERTAEQPFTPYSGEFVAPLTGTQQAGISNINQAQGMATPYYNNAGQAMNTGYQAGSGLALASAGEVNPEALTGQNINQYMSPYLGSVVDTTMANLRQQQNEEQSKILGNQITSGAFGGDRGRIAQANLARQQGLATGQTVSGLMNQGYGQALQTAQQQQAQQLAASQANRAALAGAGQSLYSMGQGYGQGMAGLGTQAQESALKGAQAQLGAGTVQQQTQQALNTANYNQFLQQQGYPFQVAQFLANIAMGTGALSGSTTNATTTSPQSFFSDRRLKDDIEKIGKTFDGQDIVRYKYKGEPGTRIGLIAQDVEKHHPDAVGLAGGYRTVDYDKATDDAAERGHFAGGGLAGGYSSEGGAVLPEMSGMGFAQGGAPDINSMMSEILNAHQGMYPYGKAGLYGQSGGRAGAYGTSQMQLPSRGLMRAELVRAAEQPGAGGQAMQGLNTARSIGSAYTDANSFLFGTAPNRDNPEGTRGQFGNAGNPSISQGRVARLFERDTPPTTPPAAPAANPPAAQPAPRQDPTAPAETSSNADGGGGDYETGGYGSDFYTGGLVRGHYAMGGMPFSEVGGYVPEGVLNDNERDKNKKALDSFTPKPAGAGQSGSGSDPGLLGGLGKIGGAINGIKNIGSLGSSLGSLFGGAGEAAAGAAGAGEAAAGAAGAAEAATAAAGATEGIGSLLAMLPAMFSDRRLKDDIEKIGKTFDGQDIVRYRYKGEPATQIGLIAQDVEKHHPGAVGLAGGYRTVDYRKATEDAADRGHFAGGGLAGMRHGYQTAGTVVEEPGLVVAEPPVEDLFAADRERLARLEGGRPESRNPNRGSTSSGPLGITNPLWKDYAPRLGLTDADRNTEAGQNQVYNAWRSGMHGRHGELTGPQANAAWMLGEGGWNALRNADPNANAYEVYRGVAPGTADRAFSQNGQLLTREMTAAQALEAAATRRAPGLAPAPEGRTGLRVPVSNDGSGQADPNGGAGGDQTPNRVAERQQRSGVNFNYPRERGEGNWLQRNQDWFVPILSGLGAMASSPSRYLGSALLQGVAGGAQQYAAMQNKAEEQQLARGTLEVSQEQARTAATREETASQQAALQVLNNFDQRYRRIVRPDGSIAFIDQTGGAPLTAEQHAQQRATLFNALMTGSRSARAMSDAQARPTAEGTVAAPVAGQAAPAGGTTPQAAPAGGGNQPAVTSGASPIVARPAAAPTAGANAPPAATGTPDVSAAPPANPQEAAALAQANRFLEPIVADLNRTLHEIEIAGNNLGIGNIPADLISTRDRLRNELREYRTGKTPIPDPNGGPENDFFVQRQIARDAQRAREEALARAEAENEFAPYIDPATGTLVQPTRRRAPPSGSSAPAPQGAAQQPAAAPSPAANEQRPATATVAPATAAVTTALPAPPPGGGSPIPQNLPPGTQIRELSRPAQQAIERDADMNSYLTSGPVMDEAIKRYHSMARALQLFQSGRTSEMTGFVAAYAADLGMPDIANAINRGQVDAQQWLGKEGLNAALQQLAAINSRFTQAEFSRVQSSGMPSITNTPQANYQMLTNGLSSLYRLRQFQTDWQAAQQQGWNSPSAFYDAWSRANPSEAFSTAAERRVGNIRGMQLPQDAQRNWVPGQTYVMPDNAPPAVQRAFANVRPGQVFRFNGLDAETPYTVLNRAQAYSTGTQ